MAMVNYMNYSTLLSLQNKLGLSLSPYVDDDDERLHDPIAGPVLSRMLSSWILSMTSVTRMTMKMKTDRSQRMREQMNFAFDADRPQLHTVLWSDYPDT